MDLKKFLQPGTALYHVTSYESLSGIRSYGLRPAAWLIQEFVSISERPHVDARRRKESIPLIKDGNVIGLVRDQGPLNLILLDGCLEKGCSVSQWIQKLNERVFFFTRRSDAEGLLQGEAYRDKRRVLIELDRTALVSKYRQEIEVADINTGAACRVPPARGQSTFQKLESYKSDVNSRYVKELTITCEIDDITSYIRHALVYEPGEQDGRPLSI